MNFVTFIGLFAAACTTISYVPQALKVIKTRRTKDLSLWTYILIVVGLSAWLAYGIFLKSAPLILANSITLFLAATILVMKIRYK